MTHHPLLEVTSGERFLLLLQVPFVVGAHSLRAHAQGAHTPCQDASPPPARAPNPTRITLTLQGGKPLTVEAIRHTALCLHTLEN